MSQIFFYSYYQGLRIKFLIMILLSKVGRQQSGQKPSETLTRLLKSKKNNNIMLTRN